MFNIIKKMSIVFAVIIVCCGLSLCITFPTASNVGLGVAVDNHTKATVKAEISKELIQTPLIFTEFQYEVFYDISKSNEYITVLNNNRTEVENAIASGDYTDFAVEAMKEELVRLGEIINAVQADIDKYSTWEQEYYYAAKTYEFLKQKGYSDIIACGIIGNMMIETSGGTLKLNPTIYNPTRKYYGLCQWSLYYRPEAADMTFEEQLEYLHKDIEAEFKTFGFCYKRGFTYEDFLVLESPEDAAYAFAKVYERCGSGSYGLRKTAARVAYEYFVGDAES